MTTSTWRRFLARPFMISLVGVAAAITGCSSTTAHRPDGSVTTTSECSPVSSCFSCGPSLRCRLGEQYCDRSASSDPGGAHYYCKPVPAACQPTPTCACLRDQGAPEADRFCYDADGGTGELMIFHTEPS